MIKETQISVKVSRLAIEELAAETNFSIHSDNKLSATAWVRGFFNMFTKSSNTNTLSDWTIEISKILNRIFTTSALVNKLQHRQEAFAKALLDSVLQSEMYQQGVKALSSPLLASFPRVFLEDSMCLKLPDNLSSAFPGAHSTKGQVATARIQYRTELKKNTTAGIDIQSFRNNDQSFAYDILNTLLPNDLVIRDLGYMSLITLSLINLMDAFFLSRFRFDLKLYDSETGEEIDLIELLKQARLNGQNIIDKTVLVGQETRLKVRFVAIITPENMAQQRRRKAQKDGNHSKDYMEFLGWTVFITNVSQQIWTAQQILKVYGFRWRIEIIFKCWKSKFKFEHLFKQKQSMTPSRAMITLCLLLVWITLFFVSFYNFFLSQVYERKQKFVSILKFAKFFKDHFLQLTFYPDLDFYIELVAQHCCYDKRNNFPNFCQNLYQLND